MRITLVFTVFCIIVIATLVQAQCPTKQNEGCKNPQAVQLDVSTALKIINDARRKVACDKKASDINDLKWNTQLATLAENVAKNCDTLEDNCVTKVIPTAGQLIHAQGDYNVLSTAKLFGIAVESWLRLEKASNQLIYSKATSIGCGLATTDFKKRLTDFVVLKLHFLECYLDVKYISGPVFKSGAPDFTCPVSTVSGK